MNKESADRKGNAKRGILWFVLIALALVTWITSLISAPPAIAPTTRTENPAPKPRDPDAEKKFQQEMNAGDAVIILKAAARNPDSFKLEKIVAMKDNVSCLTYRSQNGFGGMNRENALVMGRLLKIESSDGFRDGWNRYCTHKFGADVTGEVKVLLDLAGK